MDVMFFTEISEKDPFLTLFSLFFSIFPKPSKKCYITFLWGPKIIYFFLHRAKSAQKVGWKFLKTRRNVLLIKTPIYRKKSFSCKKSEKKTKKVPFSLRGLKVKNPIQHGRRGVPARPTSGSQWALCTRQHTSRGALPLSGASKLPCTFWQGGWVDPPVWYTVLDACICVFLVQKT